MADSRDESVVDDGEDEGDTGGSGDPCLSPVLPAAGDGSLPMVFTRGPTVGKGSLAAALWPDGAMAASAWTRSLERRDWASAVSAGTASHSAAWSALSF